MAAQSAAADPFDREVTDEDIAIIAQRYLNKWEKLSPFLDLKNADETIKRSGDYEEQKKSLLKTWKTQHGRSATYRVLIEAAEKALDMKLAHDIESMLQHSDRGKSCTQLCVNISSHSVRFDNDSKPQAIAIIL